MSDKLKNLREQQQKLIADSREKLAELDKDVDESRASEIENEYDAIIAEYDKLEERAKKEEDLLERQRKVEEREAAMEEIDRSRRPGGEERSTNAGGDAEDDKKAADKRKEARKEAFEAYIRYGVSGLTADQRQMMREANQDVVKVLGEREARAQGVGSAGIGGALVPEDFMAELIKSLADYGPLNDANIVRQIVTSTGAAMPWPTVDDTGNKGALIDENTQVTEQAITFNTKTLNAYKFTTRLVLVANELLQDSAIDVEAEVRRLLDERIGRIFNEKFTVGTGSDEPQGLVTAATLGVTAASTSAFTADEIIDLEHSVDPAYRRDPSCRWMFNDTTLKTIRKLKDGDGNYLWQPADVRAGAPASLLGHPYSVNQDMDSIEGQSPSGDARPIVFGAFNRFVVRMVRMLAIRRLDERYADYDQVGFVGFTRADSELVDTAAVKYLKGAST